MANSKENNEGYNQMARALQKRMLDVSKTLPVLDFGVIQGDYSLLTNKYPIPLPQTDYHVCRQLTLGTAGGHLTDTIAAGNPGDGTHSHGSSGEQGGHTGGSGAHVHTDEGPHVHDVLIPEKMRWIQPGDHVLVAWVGNDPVVIDIILPATEVG